MLWFLPGLASMCVLFLFVASFRDGGGFCGYLSRRRSGRFLLALPVVCFCFFVVLCISVFLLWVGAPIHWFLSLCPQLLPGVFVCRFPELFCRFLAVGFSFFRFLVVFLCPVVVFLCFVVVSLCSSVVPRCPVVGFLYYWFGFLVLWRCFLMSRFVLLFLLVVCC